MLGLPSLGRSPAIADVTTVHFKRRSVFALTPPLKRLNCTCRRARRHRLGRSSSKSPLTFPAGAKDGIGSPPIELLLAHRLDQSIEAMGRVLDIAGSPTWLFWLCAGSVALGGRLFQLV